MFLAKNRPFRRESLCFTNCLAKPISPKNTVIAFDLHNVVFKKKYQEMAGLMLKNLRISYLPHLLNPKFWHKIYKLQTQTQVAEDLFKRLTDNYPSIANLRNEFISLTNAQKPIKPTVELIKELKNQGYKLYILSNIGQDTLIELKQKFPEILDLFDGAFPARPDNNYCQKPDPLFYEQFKQYLTKQGESDKQILFIDDLKINVVAASKNNIGGIRFTSGKRLRSIFNDLNLFRN